MEGLQFHLQAFVDRVAAIDFLAGRQQIVFTGVQLALDQIAVAATAERGSDRRREQQQRSRGPAHDAAFLGQSVKRRMKAEG